MDYKGVTEQRYLLVYSKTIDFTRKTSIYDTDGLP